MSRRDPRRRNPSPPAFGDNHLPDAQRAALRRAVRLEWVTIGVLAATVAITREAGTLSRLNLWATQVTAAGPTPRVDLLKLRYDNAGRQSPPRPAR